jgi:hypothetical protein
MAIKAKKGSVRIPNPYIAFCQQYRAAHAKQFQTLSVPDQGRKLGKAWRDAHAQQDAQRDARSYRSASIQENKIYGMKIEDFNSGEHYLRDSYKIGFNVHSEDDRIRNTTLVNPNRHMYSKNRITLGVLAQKIKNTTKKLKHTIQLSLGEKGYEVKLTGLLTMCDTRVLIADGKKVQEHNKSSNSHKMIFQRRVVPKLTPATLYFGISGEFLFKSEVFRFDKVLSKISNGETVYLQVFKIPDDSNLTLLADVASHKARLVES